MHSGFKQGTTWIRVLLPGGLFQGIDIRNPEDILVNVRYRTCGGIHTPLGPAKHRSTALWILSGVPRSTSTSSTLIEESGPGLISVLPS